MPWRTGFQIRKIINQLNKSTEYLSLMDPLFEWLRLQTFRIPTSKG